MQIVAAFDPSAVTSDDITIPQSAANGALVVWNESSISLTFTFSNGDTAYVPAWMATVFHAPGTNVSITWQHQAILSASSPPLSQVIVEAYGCGEPIPTGFPVGIASRLANVGNPIQTFAATLLPFATNLVNDGNSAATQMIESTVLGETTSSVSVTNDGVIVLGNSTYSGSISSDNGGVSTDGLGNITTNYGLVGGNLTVGGGITIARSGNAVMSNGAVDNYVLAYSTFSFTTNGGSQTVAHGLGVTPSAFIFTVQAASPSTVEPTVSSADATNVTLQSSGGSGVAILGCAIG